MNVPEMQRLIDHLKALPPIPDMARHLYRSSPYPLMGPLYQELSCGTVGCICGEWALMNGQTLEEIDTGKVFTNFARSLGLSLDHIDCIIQSFYWFEPFRSRYSDLPDGDLNAERALMTEYLEWIVADPERFSKAVVEGQGVCE